MINENWALVCELGFWGWTLSAAAFLHYSFPGRGAFSGGAAISWGGAFLFCFASWILGMLRA